MIIINKRLVIKYITYMLLIILFLSFTLFLNNIIHSSSSSSFTIKTDIDKSSSTLDSDTNDFYLKHNYLHESDQHLTWFLQISDLHISEFHDLDRLNEFQVFCNQTISFIKPKVVLVTGDITDAKDPDHIGSDQYEFEWKSYNDIIKKSRVLDYSVWLDLRGNHDNFNVASQESAKNLFAKYGIMGKYSRSYMYEYNSPGGDRYVFIGLDATTRPGLRRPYNFIGYLDTTDIEMLKSYSKQASNANGTIWFGHYPTSTILSEPNVASIMNSGIAYVCGHLHTFYDMLPEMYMHHSNGLLELELGDWKVKRKFRIMSFDGGIFTFKDYIHNNNKSIYILITNPKNIKFKSTTREPSIKQMKYSTNIRMLIFSKNRLSAVKVFIDGEFVGDAFRANSTSNTPLYLVKWDPSRYKTGIHNIKVIANDFVNEEVDTHSFTLEDDLTIKLGLFQRIVLSYEASSMMRFLFYLMTIGLLCVLIGFRFYRKSFTVYLDNCGIIRTCILSYVRRFALLTSINYIFFPLILSIIYVPIGPWYVGEFVESYIGICFAWGIYVKDGLMSQDVQYMTAGFHVIFFYIPLLLDLSFQTEKRFTTLYKDRTKNEKHINCDSHLSTKLFILKYIVMIVDFLWNNCFFLFLIITSLLQIYDLYRFYSFISVILCPFKTWSLIYAVYLHFKCVNLNENDFRTVVSRSNNSRNLSNSNNNSADILLASINYADDNNDRNKIS